MLCHPADSTMRAEFHVEVRGAQRADTPSIAIQACDRRGHASALQTTVKTLTVRGMLTVTTSVGCHTCWPASAGVRSGGHSGAIGHHEQYTCGPDHTVREGPRQSSRSAVGDASAWHGDGLAQLPFR